MNESKRADLITAFGDQDYRESYAEDFLNTSLATQLKVIREQRGLTQARLAEEVGTKQTAISRMENVNNAARNIGALQKIALKLGCRLKVSFETFGSLVEESVEFCKEKLQRASFAEDPYFAGGPVARECPPQAAGQALGIDQNAPNGTAIYHYAGFNAYTVSPCSGAYFAGKSIIPTGTFVGTGLLIGSSLVIDHPPERTAMNAAKTAQKRELPLAA